MINDNIYQNQGINPPPASTQAPASRRRYDTSVDPLPYIHQLVIWLNPDTKIPA